LRRRQASSQVVLHGLNSRDVGVRVQTKPSGGAIGLEEPVSSFPCPQQLRADAGATTQVTDADVAGIWHNHIVATSLDVT